jgi:ribosomal protein S18 acetylase RimI-like enzyme
MIREYPDEPAGPFPEPPESFVDAEGREVVIERADEADRESLVEMYRSFDPADRAQGIPPVGEPAIREWLDAVLGEECVNAAARHGERAVGHATLVPENGDESELAIFVLNDYQGAGIGTVLLRTLLGAGASEGIDRVWLTVEHWNEPAISLYRSTGFETTGSEGFELEMSIRLAT